MIINFNIIRHDRFVTPAYRRQAQAMKIVNPPRSKGGWGDLKLIF